ncbi:MAG: GIY-YIG nuclease family protein [Geobacteraceae bacterium]|nr:GIY-YIG nuclease family protein [Geobacteraceae bacterium]
MEIEAKWSNQVDIEINRDGECSINLDLIPSDAGVYVFARKYANKTIPIYIGKALNLKSRIKTHLNSIKLIKGLKEQPSGNRIIIYCQIILKRGQNIDSAIKIIEKALILHAQSDGHELINDKGTKLPADKIIFRGNRTSESFAPREMFIKKALSRSK